MADIIVDGMTKVSFVPTIANPAAPTAAELTAGTSLDAVLTAMEGFDAETAEVDNTKLASKFDTKVPGRASYKNTALTLAKQDGADNVFTTLSARNTDGFIVVRMGKDVDTAFAASDELQVYPIRTGQWSWVPVEANSLLRYKVPTVITTEPTLDAVAAA